MKKEVDVVAVELEEVRYTASLAGVTTNKEYKKQLGEKQGKLRQVKEKTEAMEQLQQGVVAGLAHISDILFIPKSEDDAPVSDLHKNIEAVLDTLINEREKQLQQVHTYTHTYTHTYIHTHTYTHTHTHTHIHTHLHTLTHTYTHL
jgi:hypothetical protein